MGEETGLKEAGIFNKKLYYDDDYRKITLAESIYLDHELIEQKKANGLDPKSLKTFLLGGCYSDRSVWAMVDLIEKVNPDEQVKLVVTDINQEAIDLVRKYSFDIPSNIQIMMFQGDLTKVALKSGLVDYVRMDYTENFIPLNKQQTLLNELYRVTSKDGVVASLLEVVPAAAQHKHIDRLTRHITRSKGSVVDTKTHSDSGYNMFHPSEEYIKRMAVKTGFSVSYIDHHQTKVD